jgi:hypothetical protein
MTRRPPHSFAFAVTIIAAALSGCLGGCATSDARTTRLPAPASLTDLGLDVENPYGSVRVEVDDGADRITVTESLLTAPFASGDMRDSLKGRVRVETTRFASGHGLETLRVRVVALEPLKSEEGVNVTIRLPRCEGVRVRNAAGDAALVGVRGAIQVETSDGDIEVRCAEPVRSPVALIADSGDVHLQAPGGNEGRIELFSNTGEAVFTSTLEPLVGMSATRHQVVGVLGGGSSPITLRSDTGDVRMMIVENAMTYTRWKTGNRRLATPEKYGEGSGG